MATREFLARILPRQGYLILATFPPGGGKPKHIVRENVDRIASAATRADHAGLEVYHACASYRERKVWDERRQRWRLRTADNAMLVRAQWLDIDIGKGKAASGEGYATRQEGINALGAACKALRIPAPMIVSSGWGLHCYWVFDRDVPAEEARPRMEAFSAALSDLGFRHDASRTSDLASILRPVGTRNRKREGKHPPVEIIRDAPEISPERLYGALPEPLPAHGSAPEIAGMQDEGWASGTSDYPPSSAKQIASRCRALYDAAKAKGAVREPYWRAMIGLLKFTEEGEPLIHRWSKGYDGYSKAETQEKIDLYEKPPTTCQHFERVGAACEGCPYRGKITSPISLGYHEDAPPPKKNKPKKKAPATHADLAQYAKSDEPDKLPFWPSGYSWDGEQLHRLVYDTGTKMSEWKPISATLYYPFLRFEKEDGTRAVKVCSYDAGKKRWRIFDIETTKIAEPQALAYALGAHEVLFMPSAKSHNRQYMQDMLYGLRDCGLETTTYNAFGWYDAGCVLGDKLITKKEQLPIYLGSRVPEDMHAGMGAKGDATEWVRLVDEIYNRLGAEPFQFAICAAFAAPLVALCESDMWHGIPVALVGGSGEGKSTTAKVACSIFGDPRKFTVQANEEGTTLKALIQRVSTMRHLPLLLDEITGRDTAELQALLFALSNGKPKMRLKPSGEEISGGQHWDTITFVTGNLSITRTLAQSDVVRADATQVRVFEIPLEDGYTSRVFKGINAKDLIEHQLLSRNYGVIGQEYLKAIAKSRDKVTRLLQKERSKYAANTQEESRERFYYDLIATVTVAATIAKKLGYIHFEVDRLKQWALEHVRSMRKVRSASLDTPEDYLQAFLGTLVQHTIVTNYFRDGRQKIDGERVVEPLREPLARNATEDRRFFVTIKAIQDWCVLKRIDPAWLLGHLQKQGYVLGEPTRQRITKGTKISGIQARCIELDYDKLDGEALQLPDHITVIGKEQKSG